MRTTGAIRLFAFALASTFTFCALAAFAAQPKEQQPLAPKRLTDITLCGYHLLQPWDEVKVGFLEEATKDPYADYAVPYIADITWEYAGLSCPAEITLRLKGGLVQSIQVDVIGTGDDTEAQTYFDAIIKSFSDQGLIGERMDEVIDGEPLWEWGFYGVAESVWWKPGDPEVHGDLALIRGMAQAPITGFFGLEFGTPLPDAMLSLPFGREDINVAEDGYTSEFKGDMTATFNTPKSEWPEVFGKDAPGDFTLRIHFLDKKFATAQVSFEPNDKAFLALHSLLESGFGASTGDVSFGDRDFSWEDVFTHAQIIMQMPEGSQATALWTTQEYWQASNDALMNEG
jgi:hypothetical protein